MVMTKIDDAPFTDEQKRQIKAMGFEQGDWGHPDIVLDDPVAFFKDLAKTRDHFKQFRDTAQDFENDRGPVAWERVEESEGGQ